MAAMEGSRPARWLRRRSPSGALVLALVVVAHLASGSSLFSGRAFCSSVQTQQATPLPRVKKDTGRLHSRLALRASDDERGGPLATWTDDALDPNTPTGWVGTLVVPVVVLPYVPVSLFSSWALLTTGAGVDPGPGGLFGLLEGVATLSVFAVTFWTLVSFFTRARPLPGGSFNLLGTTQILCFLCAASLISASILNATENPFLNKSPEEIQKIAQAQLVKGQEELGKQVAAGANSAKEKLQQEIDAGTLTKPLDDAAKEAAKLIQPTKPPGTP